MKRLVTGVFATLVLLGASWMGAPAASAQDYAACNGVWVVIDYGSLGGGVATRCATSFGTGTDALRSVSSPTLSNGMITKINGKPGKPDIYQDYWSYWHASRHSDGSYGSWSYSNLGANSYHPAKGAAEGWHYISLNEQASGPRATPPNNPAKAASKPQTSVIAKAGATSTAPASAAASASAPAAAPRNASAPVSTPAAASASAAPLGTKAPATGSPVAVIATGSALAIAGGGASLWWLWRKGRKP